MFGTEEEGDDVGVTGGDVDVCVDVMGGKVFRVVTLKKLCEEELEIGLLEMVPLPLLETTDGEDDTVNVFGIEEDEKGVVEITGVVDVCVQLTDGEAFEIPLLEPICVGDIVEGVTVVCVDEVPEDVTVGCIDDDDARVFEPVDSDVELPDDNVEPGGDDVETENVIEKLVCEDELEDALLEMLAVLDPVLDAIEKELGVEAPEEGNDEDGEAEVEV